MSSAAPPKEAFTVRARNRVRGFVPRTFRPLRSEKNPPQVALPKVPTSELIDQANADRHNPTHDHEENDFEPPTREETAAALRREHGEAVAREVARHDQNFLEAHRADGLVMGSFGDPHLPEHLTKREKALEDSQWRNLMLPRLDEYARKMLPRKDLPDAAFHKHELVSKSRLARLEDYVAETDYAHIIADLDRSIYKLDSRLQTKELDSENLQAQVDQLHEEYELDRLLVLRHVFILSVHAHAKALHTDHDGSLPLPLLTDETVKHAYKGAEREVERHRGSLHELVGKYGLRSRSSQSRWWSLVMVQHLEKQYQEEHGGTIPSTVVKYKHRVLLRMVITAMEADPPRDYHRATDVLEECHREVDNMTPKQLKAAFTRRPQSLRRPASMHGHLPAADLERRPSIDTATDSEAATDDERDAPSPVSPGHHVVEYYKPSGRPLSSVSSVSSIAQDDRHANPYARPPTPLSPLRPHGHAGDRSSPKAPSSLMGDRGSISDDDNGGEGPSTWYEERHPGTEHRQQEAAPWTHGSTRRKPVGSGQQQRSSREERHSAVRSPIEGVPTFSSLLARRRKTGLPPIPPRTSSLNGTARHAAQ